MPNSNKLFLSRSVCRLILLGVILLVYYKDGSARWKLTAYTPDCFSTSIGGLSLCYQEGFCKNTLNPNQELFKAWVWMFAENPCPWPWETETIAQTWVDRWTNPLEPPVSDAIRGYAEAVVLQNGLLAFDSSRARFCDGLTEELDRDFRLEACPPLISDGGGKMGVFCVVLLWCKPAKSL